MARPRHLRGVLAGVITGAVAILVAVAILSGAAASAARALLHGAGLWIDGGASTVSSDQFSVTPTPTPTPVAPEASPVLPPYRPSPGAEIDPQALTGRIAKVPTDEVGKLGAVVIDPATGELLWSAGADKPMIPASTMKLLTSVAVLDAFGPGHRFETSTVLSASGELVLVGGGDPYLRDEPDPARPERASLAELARLTAEALAKKGITEVALRHDAGLFAGPTWNPTWPDRYGDEVAPTAALWVNGARTEDRNPGPRDPDPAQAAAENFAAALEDEGITIKGKVKAGKAGQSAEPVAEVDSETLDVIVESVLRFSDNDAAEVLFRHVGTVEGNGSIKASVAAMQSRLKALDVWVKGTKVIDGSGMSRDNRVSAQLIASVIELGLSDERPELRSLLTGLPVAASTGSLRSRFFAPGTELGRGAVRAKTGTLTGVHSLGGYTRTESGQLVIFAFLVNGGDNAYADRVYLDRVTSAVTGCGC